MSEILALWQEKFGLCLQTAGLTTAPAIGGGTGAFDATDFGIKTGKHLWKLTNRGAMLNPGQQIVDQRKATGIAMRSTGTGQEYLLNGKQPSFTGESDGNAYLLRTLFWLLFQSGAVETDTAGLAPYMVTCTPYTNPEAEVWASILRKLGTDTGDLHHIITGAIVKSLTLSSDGAQLKVSAEFQGRDWSDSFEFDTLAAVLTDPAVATLMWEDATVKLDANTIMASGFSLTINNNADFKRYNAELAQRVVLGDLTAEGELTIPRVTGAATEDDNAQIDAMLAGTDKLLTIYWGNSPATTAGDLSIIANVRYAEGVTVEGDTELEMKIPLVGVDDGTNSINISVATDESYSIP